MKGEILERVACPTVRSLRSRINTKMNIEEELKNAEQYLEQHPILQLSPGDLKREGRTIENYLKQWTPEERELWHSYYSDEL